MGHRWGSHTSIQGEAPSSRGRSPREAARRRFTTVGLLGLIGLVSVACNRLPVGLSSGASGGAATFQAHGSVEQIWVVHAQPGATLTVVRGNLPRTITSATADANGGMIFRQLTPGTDYRVFQDAGGTTTRSGFLDVMSQAPTPPSTSIYDQTLNVGGWAGHEKDGYGYLTTRDGTKLAVDGEAARARRPGPVPDRDRVLRLRPVDPDAPQPQHRCSRSARATRRSASTCAAPAAPAARSTTSSRSSRSTATTSIETVAAQPWVARHKVGMVGISYPGITQLFVAAHPAAAPRRDHAALGHRRHRHHLLPRRHPQQRLRARLGQGSRARRAAASARSWEQDAHRRRRQDLRGEPGSCLPDARHRGRDRATTPYYIRARGRPLTRARSSTRSTCPCSSPARGRTSRPAAYFANARRALHAAPEDAGSPLTTASTPTRSTPPVLVAVVEFLELFVAHADAVERRTLTALGAGRLQDGVRRRRGADPDDPLRDATPTTRTPSPPYEAEPPVRVAVRQRRRRRRPARPAARSRTRYPSWPRPDTTAPAWYFGPDGALASSKPTAATGHDTTCTTRRAGRAASSAAAQRHLGRRSPTSNWTPLPPATRVGLRPRRCHRTTVMAGIGSVDLWLTRPRPTPTSRSTLTEIRPDGKETYVQSGWLRASDRKLDPASTVLDPIATGLASDVKLLTPGKARSRVELYPFAHAFRKGSRIRISVSAPGGDRPFWTFTNLPGNPLNSIARTAALPSRVVLPLVGTNVPTPLPTCSPCAASPATSPWPSPTAAAERRSIRRCARRGSAWPCGRCRTGTGRCGRRCARTPMTSSA